MARTTIEYRRNEYRPREWIVTAACGHEISVASDYRDTSQLRGLLVRDLERAARHNCEECEQAAVEACEQAAAHAAPPAPEASDLAGSAKQVAWAEQIRAGILTAYDTATAAALAEFDGQLADAPPDMAGAVAEARAEVAADWAHGRANLEAKKAASWWIDHRETAISRIIREVAR